MYTALLLSLCSCYSSQFSASSFMRICNYVDRWRFWRRVYSRYRSCTKNEGRDWDRSRGLGSELWPVPGPGLVLVLVVWRRSHGRRRSVIPSCHDDQLPYSLAILRASQPCFVLQGQASAVWAAAVQSPSCYQSRSRWFISGLNRRGNLIGASAAVRRRVNDRSEENGEPVTTFTWAEKFESFERINSIRETNGNFDSCNSCKRLGTSRLHELHESKFPFVSRIEFIRSKLSNFSAHVNVVCHCVVATGTARSDCADEVQKLFSSTSQ